MKNLIPFILLVLFACGKTEKLEPITFQFDQLEAIAPDFEIQKVILLESDTTELLGSDLKVTYDSEHFYIANYMRPKGIHHFSKEGKHLGIAAVIGEAPGQIRRFSDFKIYRDTLQVIEGLGDKIGLHKFSQTNELVSTQEYPLNVFSFQPVEAGHWFYSGYNKVAGTHRLIKQIRKVKFRICVWRISLRMKCFQLTSRFFSTEPKGLFSANLLKRLSLK